MNHSLIRHLLSSYIDGELSTEDQLAVSEHLRHCSACRAEDEELRSLAPAIHKAATFELPKDFPFRVLRVARQEVDRSSLWKPVELVARRLVFALSVAVVVFVSVAVAFQPEEPVLVEPYLTGEHADSSATRTLLASDEYSKDDILLAALTRK